MTKSFAAKHNKGAIAITAAQRAPGHARNMIIDYRMRLVLAMVPYAVPMRLECPCSHVLAVQFAAGDRSIDRPPVLDFSNAAPRQVRCEATGAIGESAGQTAGTTSCTDNLGP